MTNGVAHFAQKVGILGDENQASLLGLDKYLRISC